MEKKTKLKNVLEIIYFILAVLSFIYSVVIFLIGSGTLSFTIWLAAGGFFTFLFVMSKFSIWKKVPLYLIWIFEALVAIGIVAFIVCQACILSHFFEKPDAGADYVIVLGAQMHDNGPSLVFKKRLDAAADYLKENDEAICIVSGAMGTFESVTEGEGGKDYLMSLGIDEDRVVAENEAMDTYQNILFSYDIIKEKEKEKGTPDTSGKKVVIVTNNFHMYRGERLAKNNIDAEISGLAAPMPKLYLLNSMVRESLGILKDVLH